MTEPSGAPSGTNVTPADAAGDRAETPSLTGRNNPSQLPMQRQAGRDGVADADELSAADLANQVQTTGLRQSALLARADQADAELVSLRDLVKKLQSDASLRLQPNILEIYKALPHFTGSPGDDTAAKWKAFEDMLLEFQVQMGWDDAMLVNLVRKAGLPNGSPASEYLEGKLKQVPADDLTWAVVSDILTKLYGRDKAVSKQEAMDKIESIAFPKYASRGVGAVAAYTADIHKFAVAADLDQEPFKIHRFLKGLPAKLATLIGLQANGEPWPSLDDLAAAQKGAILAHYEAGKGPVSEAGGSGGSGDSSKKRGADGVRSAGTSAGGRPPKTARPAAAGVRPGAGEWVAPRDLCIHCWTYGHRSGQCPAKGEPATPRPAVCPPRPAGEGGPAAARQPAQPAARGPR